ncbi:MAG TPA: type II toxin-antitoxin system VapC family toxin [Blastocatellia bacterium]
MDTDILTLWRHGNEGVKSRIAEYVRRHQTLPALTSTTVLEVYFGFENKAHRVGSLSDLDQRDLTATKKLIDSIPVKLAFDHEAARIAAFVLSQLGEKRRRHLLNDVLIAATAAANGHGVATKNARDFNLIREIISCRSDLRRLFVEIW